MGLWQDLTGKTAAEESKKAAADTFRKQQGAISDLLGYGNQYQQGFEGLSQNYAPFAQTGLQANDALAQLIRDPSSVRNLPGYQFDFDQGIQALDRSKAAKGLLNSGRAAMDIQRFGTGLADKTYGDQLARLMGLTQQGLGATQLQTNTAGQGLQGNLGARTTAYGGQMQSAGTIGQGDIAAANARAQGTQNLFNTGASLIGQGVGAFGGGGMGGISSLFGGGKPTQLGYDYMPGYGTFPSYGR